MDDRNILRLSPRDMEYFTQAIRSIENSDLSNLQNAISKDSQVIRKKNASGQRKDVAYVWRGAVGNNKKERNTKQTRKQQ